MRVVDSSPAKIGLGDQLSPLGNQQAVDVPVFPIGNFFTELQDRLPEGRRQDAHFQTIVALLG